MRARRVSLALTFGDVAAPAPAADENDRAQLIVALQEAHRRDHELVQTAARLQHIVEQQANMLQTRTIERDHFAQDGHLWALCLAWLVKQEVDEELALPSDDVNAMEGLMLSANVNDGYVRITVNERPAASEEGGGNGG